MKSMEVQIEMKSSKMAAGGSVSVACPFLIGARGRSRPAARLRKAGQGCLVTRLATHRDEIYEMFQ